MKQKILCLHCVNKYNVTICFNLFLPLAIPISPFLTVVFEQLSKFKTAKFNKFS